MKAKHNQMGCLALVLMLALCFSLYLNVTSWIGQSTRATVLRSPDIPRFEEELAQPGNRESGFKIAQREDDLAKWALRGLSFAGDERPHEQVAQGGRLASGFLQLKCIEAQRRTADLHHAHGESGHPTLADESTGGTIVANGGGLGGPPVSRGDDQSQHGLVAGKGNVRDLSTGLEDDLPPGVGRLLQMGHDQLPVRIRERIEKQIARRAGVVDWH